MLIIAVAMQETKAELSSDEGAAELATMRGEIHRMELRLGQLEREQLREALAILQLLLLR